MSEANGRDPVTGYFEKGNRLSVGNKGGAYPLAKRMNELRKELIEAATPDDIRAIYRATLGMAKGGDVAAARLLLEYLVGRPTQTIEMSGPDGGSLGLDVAGLTKVVLVALAGHPAAKMAVSEALGRAIDHEPQ